MIRWKFTTLDITNNFKFPVSLRSLSLSLAVTVVFRHLYKGHVRVWIRAKSRSDWLRAMFKLKLGYLRHQYVPVPLEMHVLPQYIIDVSVFVDLPFANWSSDYCDCNAL